METEPQHRQRFSDKASYVFTYQQLRYLNVGGFTHTAKFYEQVHQTKHTN